MDPSEHPMRAPGSTRSRRGLIVRVALVILLALVAGLAVGRWIRAVIVEPGRPRSPATLAATAAPSIPQSLSPPSPTAVDCAPGGAITLGWHKQLARPTPRLVYSTKQGFYLASVGGSPQLLQDLIDVPLAWRSYVRDYTWSSDGRYLAWFQDPEDVMGGGERKVPAPATVLLDTDTGCRWNLPVTEFVLGAFYKNSLLAWTGDHLNVYDLRLHHIDRYPTPGMPRDGLVLGVMDSGLLIQELATPMNEKAARLWLVSNAAPPRLLGVVSRQDKLTHFTVRPNSNAIAFSSSHDVSACQHYDRIELSDNFTEGFHQVQLPSLPSGQGWHVNSLEFRADGTLDAVLGRDSSPCSQVPGEEYGSTQGNRMVPDMTLPAAKRAISAASKSEDVRDLKRGPNGLVAGSVVGGTPDAQVVVVDGSAHARASFEIELGSLWSWAPGAAG